MIRCCLYIAIFLVLSSCDLFDTNKDKTPVARVNKTFLYEDDISKIIDEGISNEDSSVVISSYVNQWATEQLLLDQALINLSAEQQENYNKLVRQYKISLFTEAYKNTLVSRDLDSVISQAEIDTLYAKDKDIFLLNDELLKIRFVQVDENNSNVADIKKRINTFTNEDKEALSKMTLQFKTANLNDSVWIKEEVLLSQLPALNTKEINLFSGKFATIKDSTGIIIYKVVDKLDKGDIAPSSYIAPTLRQIILNKRKLELIKNIEKDITKDAIKNNNFEIYNKK